MQVISTWGVRNNIDFLSLYTRHAEDVRHVSGIPDRFYHMSISFALSDIFPLLVVFMLPDLSVHFLVLLNFLSFFNSSDWMNRFSFLILLMALKKTKQIPAFFIFQAREFLSKLGDLKQTHVFAKIENIEVRNFYILWTIYSNLHFNNRQMLWF